MLPSILYRLPPELFDAVLVYVHRRRDLANLCQVSKTLADKVRPELYAHIVLKTDIKSINRMNASIGAGGGLRLRQFTRGLTFLDEHVPDAHHLNYWIATHPDDDMYDPIHDCTLQEEKDFYIYTILSHIRSDNLKAFEYETELLAIMSDPHRFCSRTPLSRRVVSFLKDNQPNLKSLLAGLYYLAPRDLLGFGSQIRTMDVTFHSVEAFRSFLSSLHGTLLISLQDLRIGCDKPEIYSIALRTALSQFPQTRRLLSLRKLTLDGLMLDDLYTQFSALISVEKLSHLTLWNCRAANQFIARMYEAIARPQLSHLCVFYDSYDDDARGCLWKLVRSCTLTSLHITWADACVPPMHDSLTDLCTSSLRSLSLNIRIKNHNDLHNGGNSYPSIPIPLATHTEELGISVNAVLLNNFRRAESFWMRLQNLPDLKVLQIRELCDETTLIDPDENHELLSTGRNNRFANCLFAFIERENICPSLKGLVIASCDTFRGEVSPWHLYLKGREILEYRKDRAVAIPVSSQQLLDYVPGKILQFDPSAEWYGGRPGQFRSVK